MDINQVKDRYRKYIESFDLTESNIKRKYIHSFRVMQIATDIAEFSKFNESDKEIVTIAALLHDYGRFHQWENYKTYEDRDSIDHADKAIEFLYGDGEIINYTLKVVDYDEIHDAIKYHSKYEIPEGLSEHNKKILEVVRDADKLDIFYIYASGEKLIKEDDSDITKEVIDQYNNEKCIRFTKDNTNNDLIVGIIAMVFDLNYYYSFKLLKEKNYIDKMFESIKDKEKFRPYFEGVKKYIDKKLSEETENVR